MLQVKKRNGILVPFDKQRIVNAINKAFIEVDGTLYEEDTANDIADEIKYSVKTAEDTVSVEDIQDMVEDFLMRSERKDVAISERLHALVETILLRLSLRRLTVLLLKIRMPMLMKCLSEVELAQDQICR